MLSARIEISKNPMPESAASLDIQSQWVEDEDLTGRNRLVSNVIFGWVAHTVFLVAGFIMPRLIDRQLGQELLGVWDFGWSLVGYFGLVRMGVVSAVSRYVANYRAVGDTSGMNRVVSSVSLVLAISGLLVMGLTLGSCLLLPQLLGGRLGGNTHEAQWVIFFLGAGLAAETVFAVFSGVLSGCHRWALDDMNTSAWHAAKVVGMAIALLSGGWLWILAAIHFVGEIFAGLMRMVLAYRACEGLRLRSSLVRWATIRESLVFGAKTLIPSVSNLLLNQTTSILIVAYLGPAALALYSRPRALMNHAYILVRKMAMKLTPTVSSMDGMGDLREIQGLLIKATRYACYLALPIVLVLIVFGRAIMQMWMGPRYANGLIPAILATGYLTVLVQLPAWNILAGLNAHGRIGVARLIASLCSVGLSLVVLSYFGWGLVGIATAVALPLMILNLVDIPILVCRRFDLTLRRYFTLVALVPVFHVSPFAICLITCRFLFRESPLMGLAVGILTATAVLSVIYWHVALPAGLKQRIRDLL